MNLEQSEVTPSCAPITTDNKRERQAHADFVSQLKTLLTTRTGLPPGTPRNDTVTLMNVLLRCSTEYRPQPGMKEKRVEELARLLERAANKLRVAFHRGLSPSSVGDVMFLARLTRDEEKLSDEAFCCLMDEGMNAGPIPNRG